MNMMTSDWQEPFHIRTAIFRLHVWIDFRSQRREVGQFVCEHRFSVPSRHCGVAVDTEPHTSVFLSREAPMGLQNFFSSFEIESKLEHEEEERFPAKERRTTLISTSEKQTHGWGRTFRIFSSSLLPWNADIRRRWPVVIFAFQEMYVVCVLYAITRKRFTLRVISCDLCPRIHEHLI